MHVSPKSYTVDGNNVPAYFKFLAHLSQRLKWAIVIAHRPSSVNFHIFKFFSRTAGWILMKLGMDEVLMVPYKCWCFSARSAQGRIQGGAKIGHGVLFFRLEGYSNKPNAKQWSRSIWEGSVVIFGSNQKSNFWRVFDVFFYLVLILMQFL